MYRIAIYDMDRTITRYATWTPFLIHAARVRAPWRLALMPLTVLAGAGYLARLLDRKRLKQISQRLLIGDRLSRADADALADSFADTVTGSGTFQGARDRIAADRADGYRIVLATASYGYYAEAIAARLGIEDVIATRIRYDANGQILSRMDGENCYGPAKLRRILGWMDAEGIARDGSHVRFYSDHVSDAPVLEWADEPFAVNAHGPLRALAAQRGWPLLDWTG